MSRGDEIFSRVHGWEAGRLGQAHILVVGAGALGNEVLKNLALLGIGRISILDFDQVEPHNLSRSVLYRAEDARLGRAKAQAAAQAILALHPEVQVQIFCGDVGSDLGLGLLRQVDVVIGCVDNRLARLYLNRLCWRAGVPWVDGGILQLSGQATAYVPGHSCYECQLSTAEWTDIRARMGCADMAERYAQAGMQVTTPLAAALIGAIRYKWPFNSFLLNHQRAREERCSAMRADRCVRSGTPAARYKMNASRMHSGLRPSRRWR
jgi:molybdopterin/thiamine biosynthesis adenylyltransferase